MEVTYILEFTHPDLTIIKALIRISCSYKSWLVFTRYIMKTSFRKGLVAIALCSAISMVVLPVQASSLFPQDAAFKFVKVSQTAVPDTSGMWHYETGYFRWSGLFWGTYHMTMRSEWGSSGGRVPIEICVVARPRLGGHTFTLQGTYDVNNRRVMGGASAVSPGISAFEGGTFVGTFPTVTFTY